MSSACILNNKGVCDLNNWSKLHTIGPLYTPSSKKYLVDRWFILHIAMSNIHATKLNSFIYVAVVMQLTLKLYFHVKCLDSILHLKL